jgi:hypothetical protein
VNSPISIASSSKSNNQNTMKIFVRLFVLVICSLEVISHPHGNYGNSYGYNPYGGGSQGLGGFGNYGTYGFNRMRVGEGFGNNIGGYNGYGNNGYGGYGGYNQNYGLVGK